MKVYVVEECLERDRIDKLWWEIDRSAISGIIHGPLPNKSNSRKIVTVRGRAMVIKSTEARKYEQQFACAATYSILNGLPVPWEKMAITAVVYQENLRRDLDCELLPDLLQKVGVIQNDRAFWYKNYIRAIDKRNPRVEFRIAKWREEKP